MLGAIAQGKSEIRNWLAAGDTEATLACMRVLGATIDRQDENTLTITGGELRQPDRPLNLMNAGTGIRLLAGIMAGQPFPSILDGSTQLRRRPMKRITTPLRLMGANIAARDGCCPLRIAPAALKGIRYELPVASAQVKSAILLAGLYADSPTTVVQPGPARDHTERMLRSMGVEIQAEGEDGHTLSLVPNGRLEPLDMTVPGDFSSAAFLIVAALLASDSDIDRDRRQPESDAHRVVGRAAGDGRPGINFQCRRTGGRADWRRACQNIPLDGLRNRRRDRRAYDRRVSNPDGRGDAGGRRNDRAGCD